MALDAQRPSPPDDPCLLRNGYYLLLPQHNLSPSVTLMLSRPSTFLSVPSATPVS